MLKTFSTQDWQEDFSSETQKEAVESLESGQILYFPQLAFSIHDEEKYLLSPEDADPTAKNFSYQFEMMLERFLQAALFGLSNSILFYG